MGSVICLLGFSFFNLFHSSNNINIQSQQEVEFHVKKEASEIVSREDFFQIPEISQLRLSPDGRHVGYRKFIKGYQVLYVMDLSSNKEVQITEEDGNISNFFWGNNNRLVFVSESTEDLSPIYNSVNIDGTNSAQLTNGNPEDHFQVLKTLPKSDSEILVAINNAVGSDFSDVYRMDVYTGDLSLVEENPGNVCRWLPNDDGVIQFFSIREKEIEKIIYRKNISSLWKTFITFSWKDCAVPFGLSKSGKKFFYVSDIGKETIALKSMRVGFPHIKKVIFQDPDWDVSRVYWSSLSGTPVGVKIEKELPENIFFDTRWKVIDHLMKSQHPSWGYTIESTDCNEKKAIIRCYSDLMSNRYYLFNFETSSLTLLLKNKNSISEAKLCPMTPITYQSFDERKISGYLTLPKECSIGNYIRYPLIVNIHSGPEDRSIWGFDPVVQFFANRGYAVLQMNYRGSLGKGRLFKEAGYKSWDLITKDVVAGVKWAVDEKIADPKRIVVYGEGFGGTAALNCITSRPSLFSLGIDLYGPTNIFSLTQNLPPHLEEYTNIIYEKIGDPENDLEYLKKVSPIFHVDEFNIPLLIAHGGQDRKVLATHSDGFVEALQNKNKEVKYLFKEDEGHSFSKEENKVFLYGQIEKFLRPRLGGYYWETH